MLVHQDMKFSNFEKVPHDSAVKLVGKCLFGTEEEAITCVPYVSKGLEVFTDAYFAGGFDKSCAEDPKSVYSRNGFAIKHVDFPIT